MRYITSSSLIKRSFLSVTFLPPYAFCALSRGFA
nr:MAG TPA: hypothetical protein [Caudoviricetes sp.]